jgi:hypothetical protein
MASAKVLEEGCFAGREHGERSVFGASEDHKASPTRRKIDLVDRRAGLRSLPDQIERMG